MNIEMRIETTTESLVKDLMSPSIHKIKYADILLQKKYSQTSMARTPLTP